MSYITPEELKKSIKNKSELNKTMSAKELAASLKSELWSAGTAAFNSLTSKFIAGVNAVIGGVVDSINAGISMGKDFVQNAFDVKDKIVNWYDKTAELKTKGAILASNLSGRFKLWLNPPAAVEIDDEDLLQENLAAPITNSTPVDNLDKSLQKIRRSTDIAKVASGIDAAATVASERSGSELRGVINQYKAWMGSRTIGPTIANLDLFQPMSECMGAYLPENFVLDTNTLDIEGWDSAAPMRPYLRYKLQAERPSQIAKQYRLVNQCMRSNAPTEWQNRVNRYVKRNYNLQSATAGLPIDYGSFGTTGSYSTKGATSGMDKNLIADGWWAFFMLGNIEEFFPDNGSNSGIINQKIWNVMRANMSTKYGINLRLIDAFYPISNPVVVDNTTYSIEVEGSSVVVDARGNKVVQNPTQPNNKVLKA